MKISIQAVENKDTLTINEMIHVEQCACYIPKAGEALTMTMMRLIFKQKVFRFKEKTVAEKSEKLFLRLGLQEETVFFPGG